MIDYIYDGSFEGMLTCIYHNYYTEPASGIYSKNEYQASMLQESKDQKTEEEHADKVYDAIRSKVSAYDLRRIYKVYKSSVDERENKILEYLKFAFKQGSSISLLHGDDRVFQVQKIEKKVNFEIHRLQGLIRFNLIGEKVMYSPVEPDHDVLEFLAPHFSRRFGEENFIIHDKRRSKAVISSQKQWYISDFHDEQVPLEGEKENKYEDLWHGYFKAIAIKERINPRCQKAFMPVRYWKHLTEMKKI